MKTTPLITPVSLSILPTGNEFRSESPDKTCADFNPGDDSVEVITRVVPCNVRPTKDGRIAVLLEKSEGHYRDPVGFRFYGVRTHLEKIRDKRRLTAIPLNQLLSIMFEGRLFGVFDPNQAFARQVFGCNFVVDFTN